MSFNEKDILVVLEVANDAPVGVSLENIAAGVACGGSVVAISFGSEAAAKAAIEAGAEKAIVINGVDTNNVEAIASAVVEVVGEDKPCAIFTAASPVGKAVAPMIAAKLGTGSVSDAVAISAADGVITYTVGAFAGNVLTDVVLSCKPEVASIRGGAVAKLEPVAGKAGEIEVKDIALENLKTQVKDIVKEIGETVNIAEAEVIVCGGRGMGSQENFDLLNDLADVTGGVIACSRPAQEAGWCTRDRLVGQSGKIVAPKVYFAVAISGATQHVSAMLGSGYIIAVNKDEEAPIFDIADVGIVGNAMDVVPMLVEEIKKLKA